MPDAAEPTPDAPEPTPDAAEPDASPDAGPPPGPTTTYRVGSTSQEFDSLDPTHEYTSAGWAVLRNLLVRNLVGYRHVAGAAGLELIPDLATEVPEPTDGGLTYTFTLRPGVRFGPPLSRPITSHDILFAMRRLTHAPVEAPYAFYYYDLIVGMSGAPFDDLPDMIAGIETPDDDTIVFHLTRPSGDFLHIMAMPAASPMPEEVAGCFAEPHTYALFSIASGPYMVEGSELLDASSCATLAPHPGWDLAAAQLRLVRNPDYAPASDSPDHRPSLVDGFHFTLYPEDTDLFALLENGELDGRAGFIPPAVIDRYQADPVLEDRLHISPGSIFSYIAMKLTQPPFDDVHVRRAVNHLIDRESLIAAFGPDRAQLATHAIPPLLTGGHPTADEYAPYGTGGNLAAARAEMALSRYDSNGDGRCDGSVCNHVRHLARDDAPPIRMVGELVDTMLADIGIHVDTEFLTGGDAFDVAADVTNDVAIVSFPSWLSDYPDVAGLIAPLALSSTIEFGINYSLVGLTEAQALELGVPGNVTGVPSLDADIAACSPLADPEARFECWRDVDVTLSEDVVPWVPWAWRNNVDVVGAAVTAYEFDEASAGTALSRVAVDPTKQN